jgi:hypothetical protein
LNQDPHRERAAFIRIQFLHKAAFVVH